jgi:hypothetical protein
MSSSGHFFGLLFFGPAKKSDSGPLGSESAAGNGDINEISSHAKSAAGNSSTYEILSSAN